MTKYKCHKEVHAKPMHKGEYNAYRGWVIPAGERKDEEGYLVIYNKDTPDHYESWSPKKLFDDGYTKIKPSCYNAVYEQDPVKELDVVMKMNIELRKELDLSKEEFVDCQNKLWAADDKRLVVKVEVEREISVELKRDIDRWNQLHPGKIK